MGRALAGVRAALERETPTRARLTVSVPGARRAAVVDGAIAEVRHVCGLDLDLAAFRDAAAGDPVLGGLATRLHGLRPTLSPSPFEMLVSSVCAQQINLALRVHGPGAAGAALR